MNSSSLFNKTLIYSIGSFATKGLSFILVFVTTFYLSKNEVGEFDLFLTTLSLLIPLFTLQISDAVLRWLIDTDDKLVKIKVLTSASIILFVVNVVLGLFAFYVSLYLGYNFLIYLLFLLFFQSYFLLFQQFQRATHDNKGYVLSNILYTVVYIFFSLLFLVFLKEKVEGLLFANCIAVVIVVLFVLIRNKVLNYIDFSSFDKKTAKDLLVFSIPLVPNNLSWWAISSANRYFILFFLGISANGIFAIAYKFPTILLILMNIFYLAWQEKTIETIHDKERDLYYSKVFDKFVLIVFLLAINLVAFNKVFLKYFVNSEFADAGKYVSILLLAIVFNALSGFYGTLFFGTKNTKLILKSSLISGVLVIVASYFLIPVFSLYGASIAIFMGYFVLFLLRFFQVKNYLNIRFPLKKFFFLLFLYLCFSTVERLGITYIEYALPVFSILISTLYLNKEIRLLFNKI